MRFGGKGRVCESHRKKRRGIWEKMGLALNKPGGETDAGDGKPWSRKEREDTDGPAKAKVSRRTGTAGNRSSQKNPGKGKKKKHDKYITQGEHFTSEIRRKIRRVVHLEAPRIEGRGGIT